MTTASLGVFPAAAQAGNPRDTTKSWLPARPGSKLGEAGGSLSSLAFQWVQEDAVQLVPRNRPLPKQCVCVCACVWAHTCSLSCLHGLTQHFSISETRPVVQRSSKLQGQSEKPQKRDRVEDGRLMGMDPSLNGQEAFKNVLN